MNTTDMIEQLKKADDAYFNATPIISDSEYDALYKATKAAVPHHVYFTGVGSDVRGGKIDLPYQMGSLDQVYHGEVEEWVAKHTLDNYACVCTEKLDGTSAMVIYDDNGDLQIAYSRGNGIQGADITRHIKNIPSVPNKVSGPMVVRGEVIISKAQFPTVQSDFSRHSSTDSYKNARNAVAGIMNRKTNPIAIYQHVDFIAYEIVGSDKDKFKMLADLRDNSFLIPNNVWLEGEKMTDDRLTRILEQLRFESKYEIDGIVIDVDLAVKRAQINPTKDTLNPAYSVKYKVADDSNVAIATVKGVEWNVSKHGYLKPRVNIEPVDLVGVTINYATGFNAKFIQENKIGPGAQIQITRSGDVIPFIQEVVKPATSAEMPSEDFTWNETGVDAILLNMAGNRDIDIKQLIDFFASIEAPMLREGNVVKLYDAGFATAEDIISLTEMTLRMVLGENGSKVFTGLQIALDEIPLWKLMGSTNFFGRGVGCRKMKKLTQAIPGTAVFSATVPQIAAVESFDDITAQKIVSGMDDFCEWVGPLINDGLVKIAKEKKQASGALNGQKVCMTGFRDKSLQEAAENAGGTIQSGVSSKTNILVTTDPNSTSGKAKKARDLGVKIMSVDDFKDMLNGV